MWRFSSAILFTAAIRAAISSLVKPSGKTISQDGLGRRARRRGLRAGRRCALSRPTTANAIAASTPTPEDQPPRAASARGRRGRLTGGASMWWAVFHVR